MTQDEMNQVRRGDGLIVSFGAKIGTQVAMALGRNRTGALMITKYRKRSKSWTKPLKVAPAEIVGRSREYQHQGLPSIPTETLYSYK
ncbi:MAG: hypothetical protein QOH47_2445 [Sphingomonadales bacterium]|nr:hypothetical protein [Sphingomonadales bacterium]